MMTEKYDFYISARKMGTEPWQFVRTTGPQVYAPHQDPFVISSEAEAVLYLLKLTKLGYQTLLTRVDKNRSKAGIYVGNPVVENIADLVKKLQDDGYTGDLPPPRHG